MSTSPMREHPLNREPILGEDKLGARDAARLVPQSRMSGPIPWVIAIMIALVVIASAGGLALRNLADAARADLSGAITVQIVEADAELRSERAELAAGLLQEQPQVSTVRIVPDDELSSLLEPWLGSGASSEDVPIPALIDVELSGNAGPVEVEQLQQAINEAVPNARVDAQSDWLQPVYSALAALQYLALGLVFLVAIACAAAVWLASRSALANHRDTVEILHLLGGTDQQLTKVFLNSVIRDALWGSLIGLVLGIAAVWLLGRQFSALDSGMVAGGGLGWIDWLLIAAIPFAGVGLAMLTGQITILSALRKML